MQKVAPFLLHHKIQAYKNKGYHNSLSGYFILNNKPIYIEKCDYIKDRRFEIL